MNPLRFLSTGSNDRIHRFKCSRLQRFNPELTALCLTTSSNRSYAFSNAVLNSLYSDSPLDLRCAYSRSKLNRHVSLSISSLRLSDSYTSGWLSIFSHIWSARKPPKLCVKPAPVSKTMGWGWKSMLMFELSEISKNLSMYSGWWADLIGSGTRKTWGQILRLGTSAQMQDLTPSSS